MGASGGSQAQKKAKEDHLASDETEIESLETKCKAELKVLVLSAETGEAIEGIKVDAKAGRKALPQKTSVAETGLADFAEVKPKKYTISIALSDADLKKYAQHPGTKVKAPKHKTTQITVKLKPVVLLRMIFVKWDATSGQDKPVKDLAWKLTSPYEEEGTTGSDGLVEVAVLKEIESGELEVTWPTSEEAEDPKAEKGAATDYPIKIQYADWKHKPSPPAVPKKADHTIKWSLAIADLADGDNEDGAKARLYNMGFPVDDEEVTQRSVKAYQALYLDEADGSGAISDVLDDVKERHDIP